MELDYSSKIAKIRPYLWTLYPLVVFLIIVISYTQIIAGPDRLLEKLGKQNSNINAQQQQKTARETKLNMLKNAQVPVLQQKMADLVERMPTEFRAWEILTELKTVGKLESFHMSESRAISVDYLIEDSEKLAELLSSIESLNPLISITGVTFDLTKVKLDLVSANSTLKSFQLDHNRALPSLSK